MCSIQIIDSLGIVNTLTFTPNSTQNLMVFITDALAEDIGDCKGRAWCGTCMVQQLKGGYTSSIKTDELVILNKYTELSDTRLACQIFLNADLHNTIWKVLDSRCFM